MKDSSSKDKPLYGDDDGANQDRVDGQNGVQQAQVIVHLDLSGVENESEFRAHVYQQVFELEPFLIPASQILVLGKRVMAEDGRDPEFLATLVTTIGNQRLQAQSRNASFFAALTNAKNGLVQALNNFANQTGDTHQRNWTIDSMLKGELTLH